MQSKSQKAGISDASGASGVSDAFSRGFGEMKIKVSALEYHRNGISGEGFTVARFSFKGEGRSRIEAIATVFNADEDVRRTGYCAVVSLNEQGQPDITSCWRGDHFETDLRFFIESDAGKRMMFPHLRLMAASSREVRS